ncbi:MAG: 5'-methylthioadenosine/S-adenosylhomocysteine nucleosidase [Chloroflexi bacterium]|nr:5'-methylthioadenosine/S-adenosylhomocysteine nucleosidase [Chloroflexota bacterium]
MTILIAAPIPQEYEALTDALSAMGLNGVERDVGRLTAMQYDGGLLVAQGGLGKAQFAAQTQHIISHLEIESPGELRALVCAGTCGRLDKSLSVGDVVVATQTVEHDFNRGMALIKMPLPSFDGDAALIAKLREIATREDLPCKLHFGGVASGDEGIASEKRIRELQESTGALVVAWEGAGGARAAQLSGVPYLEIRAISDGAGEDAMQEFWSNIPIAMGSIAVVVRELAGWTE